ncbi:MAG: sel1 repeat family protein [Lachnospiraceae bacterium]|nr:sel1 repeat family protein [Lachnospiraceae bacterium]
MQSGYYERCPELDRCNALIEKYWNNGQYEQCFAGHLELAEQGYPLAECQVGYFYYESIGVAKDIEKAVYWTERAARHGDRDGQYNLACFYEEGIGVETDLEKARYWCQLAAEQNQEEAVGKCRREKMLLQSVLKPKFNHDTINCISQLVIK